MSGDRAKCWIFPLTAAADFVTDCDDEEMVTWAIDIESNSMPSKDGCTFLKTLTERYPEAVAKIQHGDFLVFVKDDDKDEDEAKKADVEDYLEEKGTRKRIYDDDDDDDDEDSGDSNDNGVETPLGVRICGNWDESPGMMVQMYRGVGGPTLLGFEFGRDGAPTTIHRVFVSWTERYPNPLHFILDTSDGKLLGERVETGQPTNVKTEFAFTEFVSLDTRDCKVVSHQIGIFNSKRCTGKCMGLESTMPDGYSPSGPPYSIIHTSDGVEYIYSEDGSWEIVTDRGPVHIYTLEKFGKRITLLFPSFDHERQNYDEYLGKDPLKENPIVSAALLTDSEFPGLCFTTNGQTESRGYVTQRGLSPFSNWFQEFQYGISDSLLRPYIDDIYNSYNIKLLTEDQLYLSTLSPKGLSLKLRKLRSKAVVAVREELGFDSSLTAADKLSRVKTELDRRFPVSNDLDELRILFQPGVQFGTLGEAIGRLTSLQYLELHLRRLTSLPESFNMLTSLELLRLNGNRFSNLPESLGKLTSLSRLWLSNNRLTSLPESLGKLTSLTELWLPRNKLRSLPESFGKLTGLTELKLDVNQLTCLPESFGQLTRLERLSLNNNQLTHLPESFIQLRSLTGLWLQGNAIYGAPLEGNKLDRLPGKGNYENKGAVMDFLTYHFAKQATQYRGVEYTSDWDCQSSKEASDSWLAAVTKSSGSRQELCDRLRQMVDGEMLLCGLCSESLLDGQEIAGLSCGHLFHWVDLEEYARDSSECPECGDLFRLQSKLTSK